MKIQNEKSTNKILDELKGRLDKIEEKESEQDDEIEDLKIRMDEHDQRAKNTQMIATGLKDHSNTEAVLDELNEKLETDLQKRDILYVLKLGKNEENKPNRTRVVFTTKEKKDEVMARKAKLKDTNLWLADVLTPYRQNLAYSARLAKKSKKIEETWVHDGRVYMKKRDKDRPEIIRSMKDLPK
jgi:hypothetical protein